MAVVVALILLLWGIKYAGKGNYFVDNGSIPKFV